MMQIVKDQLLKNLTPRCKSMDGAERGGSTTVLTGDRVDGELPREAPKAK